MTSGGARWAGVGVRVALVDSWVKTSKDLEKNRILAFFDFTKPADEAVLPTRAKDDYGHARTSPG